MGNHQLTSHGRSDTGKRRSHNEDAFGIYPDSCCFAVADGVGGAAAGDVASRIFVDEVARQIGGERSLSMADAVSTVKSVFLAANEKILNHARENAGCTGMSCTAEVLIIHEEGFVAGHVGDSRSYRFRGGRLTRLTRDHSLVQQQLDDGEITPEEFQDHRFKNVILRAVGAEEVLDVDIIRGGVRQGDQFLLCSDGLTDMVAEQDICQVLGLTVDPQEKTGLLVEAANRAGGRDNITAVLVEVLA